MIRITRGVEPADLPPLRTTQLTHLRSLGRSPASDDIVGYRLVAADLWKRQHHKCCYCEHRIMRGYHDVEHYRPKGRANRLPGCQLTHGYWWLAFSWDNLLYACPGCNRTGKNDSFPLDNNCSSLVAEAAAPGSEIPLLLDPGSGVNPIEHIEFVKLSVGLVKNSWSWWARPRNGSRMGNFTIDICDLNRDELRELRDDHFETILLPQIKALDQALRTANRRALMRELSRALGLLEPRNVNVAFTYDALRASVPNARLLASGHKGWPRPDEVGV